MRTILLVAALLASNAQAQSSRRTDDTTYADNTASWVLHLQTSSTNVDTGIVESRTVYNAQGLPELTYAFDKLQQRLTYTADGNLATASDNRDTPTFDTTVTFSGWKRGIPQSVTFGDGTSRSAVVDDFGLIRSITDEVGATTCYAFDAAGRLTTISYPSETSGVCDSSGTAWNQTQLDFAPSATPAYGLPAGHWQQRVLTGNGDRKLYFDALWRPVVEETFDHADIAGTLRQVVTRYDVGGRVAFKSYPMRGLSNYAAVTQGVRTTYDGLDRPTRVEQDSELGVLATTTEYLSNFQVRVTNPRGHSTTTSFQAHDAPTTESPVSIAQPAGVTTTIDRDVFGKPRSITRAGGGVSATRAYWYTAHQELCRVEEPETGASFMAYDAAGNHAWSAAGYDPTQTQGCVASNAVGARRVDRTYDQRGRLKTLTFPDGNGNQVWSYDADGKPQQIVTQNNGTAVTNTYAYNQRRLLTSERVSQPEATWSMGYAYDGNGHLNSHTQPGGEVISYLPNALGQPTQATSAYGSYATDVSYHANGAIAQFTYGNGIVHTMAQNARQLPDRSKDQYGGTAATLDDSYVYDGNANVAAIIDGTAGASTSRTMGYDALDRLTSVVSPLYGATGANYSYDALDNLVRVNIGGANARDHWYCYDATWRLTNIKTGSCGGVSVTGIGYDPQGNVRNKNGLAYGFDFGNRLRYVTGKESYRYDGHGRRVLANSPADGNLLSMHGNDGVLRYQRDERTTRVLNHVYLSGSLVATRDSLYAPTMVHRLRYQHTDALGSPIAVTDEHRVVVERNAYEPFGARLGGVVKDGPGYTGHVMDAATGLTYMQQRYHDSALGVFLSVDPVSADATSGWNFNRYNYAANNPYRFKDPDGRIIETVWDVVNVAMGAASLGRNLTSGNYAGASADAGGLIVDAVATAIPGVPGGAGAAIKAARLADNARQGAKAEKAVAQAYGQKVAGERVTLEASTGQRSVTDIVTTEKGVVEVKSGNAQLSPGQRAVKDDVDAGRSVIPRGQNAAKAGLNPNQPTQMKCYVVERC